MTNGIVTFDAWDGAGNLAWSAQGANAYPDNACTDVTQANAAGHVVSRSYDARNRLKTLSFPDGIGNQSWTYTPDGLPNTIVTANGSGPQVTNSYHEMVNGTLQFTFPGSALNSKQQATMQTNLNLEQQVLQQSPQQ